MKTPSELKQLHGQQYAIKLELNQNVQRLERLIANTRLTPNDNVLDVGCGSGMLMPQIAPFVKSYTGVDFSEPFIELANARKTSMGITNAKFECADIKEFCKKNTDVFSVAFALDLSEHIYDEEWLQILMVIKSALIRGGKLYLHTPNSRFILEIMKKHNFILKQFAQHVAVRTLDENIALLKEAGFTISRALLIPHYNLMRITHPLSFIPFIGEHFEARIFIEALR